MQAAARLLSEQGNTVQEVMYRVGFSNASYFSKCFNNEYGINPSELNKQTN
jgi:AraC-like DNA-binding protein